MKLAGLWRVGGGRVEESGGTGSFAQVGCVKAAIAAGVERETGRGLLGLAGLRDPMRLKRMAEECAGLTGELKNLAVLFEYLQRRGESEGVLAAGGRRVAALEEKLAKGLEALLKLREEVEADLGRLKGDEREIMRMRYVEGMDWEEIYPKLNFSRRSVFYIHRRAIGRLEAEESGKRAGRLKKRAIDDIIVPQRRTDTTPRKEF